MTAERRLMMNIKKFFPRIISGFCLLLSVVGAGFFQGGCATARTQALTNQPQASSDQPKPVSIGVEYNPSLLKALPLVKIDDFGIGDVNVTLNMKGDEDDFSSCFFFGPGFRFFFTGSDLSREARNDMRIDNFNLPFDLGMMAYNTVRKALPDPGGRFLFDEDIKKDSYRIVPFAIVNFLDSRRARIWTVLDVEYWDLALDEKLWEGWYMAGAGKPLSFSGPNSCALGHWAALNSRITSQMGMAVQTLVADLEGKLRDVQKSQQMLTASFGLSKKPQTETVQILKSTPQWDMVTGFDGAGFAWEASTKSFHFSSSFHAEPHDIIILPKGFGTFSPVPEDEKQ